MGYFHACRDEAGEHLELVHCDISPTNLLVTDEGFLKIIDFGIARAKGHSSTHREAIPGKLSYMSPEQAAREALDHRSDIFSLGIVLYEITVGKRLFRGPAAEVMNRLRSGEVPPPTYVRRDFPTTLEGIILRTLERHPSERYQTAYELAGDLEDFLGESGLHAGPVRIARYLDQLTAALGGSSRPELHPDDDGHDEDELDFDRDMFGRGAGPTGRSTARRRVASWEEYEEKDDDIAAALGMDVATYRKVRSSWTRSRRSDPAASDQKARRDEPGRRR